jgi:transposase
LSSRIRSVQGRRRLREEISLQEIDIRLQELELVESITAKLDKQIASIVEQDEKAKLLDTLPGVAPYTALFLSSALDNVDRFPDSEHACAYLGLVPSLHQVVASVSVSVGNTTTQTLGTITTTLTREDTFTTTTNTTQSIGYVATNGSYEPPSTSVVEVCTCVG